METFGIVAEFYVSGNIVDGMFAGRVLGPVYALVFEDGEERFGHGVVVTDSGASDGLADVETVEFLRVLRGCVVAAAVGVKYRAGEAPAATGGHGDSRRDPWCRAV